MRQTFSGKVKRGETEVQELPVERRVLPGKYKAIYLGDNCSKLSFWEFKNIISFMVKNFVLQ